MPKAVRYDEFGGIDVLRVDEVERLVDLGDDRVELDDHAVLDASDVHSGCRRLIGRPVLEAEVTDVVEPRRGADRPEGPVRVFGTQLFGAAFEILAPAVDPVGLVRRCSSTSNAPTYDAHG